MLFLNAWLLAGVLGIAVPVILHLLNRRSARVMDWGAMRFLVESAMRRRRRVLLEDILLLVCRCLVVALPALALARPFIPAGSTVPWSLVLPLALLSIACFGASFALWRYRRARFWTTFAALVCLVIAGGAVLLERHLNLGRLGGDAARDVAIVIESSDAMTMLVDGVSNFDRALQEARDIVERTPRGGAFSLIMAGPVPIMPMPAPTSDRGQLYRLLDAVHPTRGSVEVVDALGAAALALSQGHQPVKQIVFIGNQRNTGWHPRRSDMWTHLQAAFDRLPSPPQVIWRQLPLPPTHRNLALTDLNLGRDVIGTDRDLRIGVRILNTGSEAVTPERVELRVGQRAYEDISVGQIEPGVAREVVFFHRFDQSGAHAMEARIVVNDELSADNIGRRVVQVLDTLNVLVVESDPRAAFGDRSAVFAALALAPDARRVRGVPSDADTTFLIAPHVVGVRELLRWPSFDDYAVVILADAPNLPAGAAARLADYVAAGGGLLVATGARAQPGFYNRWTHDGQPVLPVPLASLRSAEAQGEASPAPETITLPGLRTPGVGSGLASIVVERYWELNEPPQRESAASPVVGRLNNGAAWLASAALSEGRVLHLTSGIDAQAGNLVSRPVFIPLIHQLVYTLARPPTADLNVSPSRGLTLLLDARQGARVGHADDPPAVWTAGIAEHMTGMDGTTIPVEFFSREDRRLAMRVAAELTPGLYRVRVPDMLASTLQPFMDSDGMIPLNVKTELGGHGDDRITSADIDFLNRFVDLRIANSDEDVLRALTGRAFGRELWRILALAALALVVAEIALAHWIAVQRHTGEQTELTFDEQELAARRFHEQLNRMREAPAATGDG